MKTKKQLRKNVVRTIKSILATVLLLTCIEYFPTIASAEGEDAGTANETISEYGSTELAEAAEQSQEGSTIIVNQPQQEEEQASEPAQEQQEEVLADIQQQNTVENDEVSVSDPEKVTLTISVKDINSTVSEYEKTIAEKIKGLAAQYKDLSKRGDAYKIVADLLLQIDNVLIAP